MNYKTTNQLMNHLRQSGIKISGSKQKKELMLVGYYHGYKGFRFCGNKSNRLQIDSFDELKSIIAFDMSIKSIFYAPLMQLETALKSYVGQLVIEEAKSSEFNDIFRSLILPCNIKNSKNKDVKSRLDLRNSINQAVAKSYNGSKIASHFYSKHQEIPLWGILEVIDLGTFGNFIKYLRSDVKEKISLKMGFRKGDCTGGKLANDAVFALKELRNSVAHNNPIFDVRFHSTKNTSRNLCASIERCTNIEGVSFSTIVDFLILIIFIMLSLGFTKSSVRKTLIGFRNALNEFKESVTPAIYHKIVHTDAEKKIRQLDGYISIFNS